MKYACIFPGGFKIEGEFFDSREWAESVGVHDLWTSNLDALYNIDNVYVSKTIGEGNFLDVRVIGGDRTISFSSMQVKR